MDPLGVLGGSQGQDSAGPGERARVWLPSLCPQACHLLVGIYALEEGGRREMGQVVGWASL